MLQPSGPVQSAYPRYNVMGQPGTPATETGWDADTKIFEEEASPPAGVGFGLAVSQGVNDVGIRLGGPSGRVFVGITLANKTQNVSEFTDKYAGGDNVPVAVRGDIFVIAQNAVIVGEAVYFSATTGQLGHSGGTLIDNARWMTTTAAGAVGVVRLPLSTGNQAA